jgi:hypothetical protein
MEFCPVCKFMVYTKLNKESETPSLSHYCKNCHWENEIKDLKGPVYKRNYEEDHIAEKALINKYTIYDVTLPRVEYECVNTNCATVKDIDSDKSFLISNIPADLSQDEFDKIFQDETGIDGLPLRIKLTQAIVSCDTIEDKERLILVYKSKTVDESKLEISEYKKPDKEVLYIKYDPTNMKYLYLCAICGSSWKKT